MDAPQHQDIIGDIYEASYNADHWPVVLRNIADITQSDSAAMVYRDNELEQANVTYAWNISQETLADFSQMGHDPHFKLLVDAKGLGIASTVKSIIPDRNKLESYYGDAFTRFSQKHDMYYIGGVILFQDDIRSLGIGLQRSQTTGPWRDELIEQLTHLSPHIQRALHIHKEFTRLRMREQALKAGLDKLLMRLHDWSYSLWNWP